MALIHGYRQWLRALRLAYYEAARNHLTRTNPCHPDLPGIVLTINHIRSTQ